VRPRGGRRLLAPLVGLAATAALLAGCGAADAPAEGTTAADSETTAEDSATEATSDDTATDDGADDADTGDDDAGGDGASDDDGAGDDDGGDASDDATDGTGDDATEGTGDDPAGENLFEGTWGFGHDTKVLSADELADLLEQEAEARGPAEMSLSVECGDGVDTGTQDYEAECIAYADEGVEHLWQITVGPADAGMEVEVTTA
jgi:hypothetical protein